MVGMSDYCFLTEGTGPCDASCLSIAKRESQLFIEIPVSATYALMAVLLMTARIGSPFE